ncbi:MAG: hypothetical protein EOO38_04345 [Cytophagaceae bacterium]|nr:MAG: hypothetical protein EOO38_04345 [Cytophagaceae bacterium]
MVSAARSSSDTATYRKAAYTSPTFDKAQDVLYRGTLIANGSNAATTHTAAKNIFGGGNVAILGGDMTMQDLNNTRSGKLRGVDFNKEFYIEGLRTDFTVGNEDDAIFAVQSDLNATPNVTIQRTHIKGLHGTHNSHGVKVAITSISAANLVTTSAPHGLTTSDDVIIADTTFEQHNRTWAVASVPSATTFTIASPNYNIPIQSTASTGGNMWQLHRTANGNHADGFQADDTSVIGSLRMDNVTIETSYDALISGRRTDIPGQQQIVNLSRLNVRRKPISPHDYANYNIYMGDDDAAGGYPISQRGGRSSTTNLYEVWAQPWAGGQGLMAETWDHIIYPTVNAKWDGQDIGASLDVSSTPNLISWNQGSPTQIFKGSVKLGTPATDFAPWGTPGDDIPGAAYRNTVGYAELMSPVKIPDIAVSNLTVSAAAAVDMSIGWVSIPYPIRGYIIDVTLSDDLGGKLKMVGSNLRVAAALTAGTYTFTLSATIGRDVRGNSISSGPTLSKNFTLTVN